MYRVIVRSRIKSKLRVNFSTVIRLIETCECQPRLSKCENEVNTFTTRLYAIQNNVHLVHLRIWQTDAFGTLMTRLSTGPDTALLYQTTAAVLVPIIITIL